MYVLLIVLILVLIYFYTTIIYLQKYGISLALEKYRLKKENADYAQYNQELYETINKLKKEIEAK